MAPAAGGNVSRVVPVMVGCRDDTRPVGIVNRGARLQSGARGDTRVADESTRSRRPDERVGGGGPVIGVQAVAEQQQRLESADELFVGHARIVTSVSETVYIAYGL